MHRYDRPARSFALLIVLTVALATPGSALAHSGGPAIALDYRLRLSGDRLPGVHAEVVDGDKSLRLRVDSSTVLVVKGLLGEPFLRFAPSGVWASRRSPTTAATKLATMSRSGPAWVLLTAGHGLTWHDHRLTPPADLAAGASAPWALPLTVDGRAASLTGTFTRFPRPRAWPWIAVSLGVLGVLLGLRRRLARGPFPTLVAVVAAAATTVSITGFAAGDAISRGTEWAEAVAAGLIALAAVATLPAGRAARGWAAALAGISAAALSLGSLSVFWHGVVISTFSAGVTRLLTVLGLVGGVAATVLGGMLADIDEEPAG